MKHCASSMRTPLPLVPGTIPGNRWDKEVLCWKAGESPPTLASNSNPRPTPPSTLPLHFDEEDSLSQPKDIIATSFLEPKARESPASPASNSKDMPPNGQSVKGNFEPPPPHQPCTPLHFLTPPQVMTPRPYVLIRGKRYEVPEAYPKGAKGWLVNDQKFIDELNEYLVKDICDACAQDTNPHAKPKPSDTKSDLIYKRVFAGVL